MMFALLVSSVLAGSVHAAEPTSTTTTTTSTATTTTAVNTIGVAECDDYINKYEACVNSKVPESSRAALKATLDQTRQQYKTSAADANAKVALASSCKAALDAAKTSMQAYGCNW